MDAQQLLAQVTDNVTVARVFGDPVQHGDTVVLPCARIRGGAGGGTGSGASGEGSGNGSGGGYVATPAGVFVIRGDTVEWRPALDLTRIVVGGQVAAVILALVVRSILRRG